MEEIRPATPQRFTLKEFLELPECESPRNVLDARFDYYNNSGDSYYAYADTISICTRLLKSNEQDVKENGVGTPSCRNVLGLFKRFGSFPVHRSSSRMLSFRKSVSFSFNRVTPLSSSSEQTKNGWRHFPYGEIECATSFFNPENLIGKGGYADVYKGCLSNGQLIAVKKLTRGTKEEQGTSFLTELGILGHVCHPNTTPLLGFCVEQGLHLVFEFYPCGSLATMLHGMYVMEWPARFKVAVGTAKGLHYLHSNCRRRIIHRDIKASNILLGPDFEPQITDFGLAKWLPAVWTHHTVPIEGTFGYLAPEYFLHGIVDEKTDVFAYGVLLLELVTGVRPIDNNQKSLVIKVRCLLQSGNLQQLVDPRLKGRYNVNEMQRLLFIARLCIRQSPVSRPSMEDIVKILVEERDIHLCWSSLWDKYGGEEEIVTSSQMSTYKALAYDSCMSP